MDQDLRDIRLTGLKGKVQHYEWGGVDYLPALLGVANPGREPFAEYWMGSHPLGNALLPEIGEGITLGDWIARHPERTLSQPVFRQFGGLPFLLKILDVREMLSIQVHPTRDAAAAGYADEEARGIPLNAHNRNYKDTNHKPEIMLAISEFWLLHGFKELSQIELILDSVPEFNVFLPLFRKEGFKSLYQFVMEMDQSDLDVLFLPLVKREIRMKREGLLDRSQPGWWVAKLFEGKTEIKTIDRGIFSIYCFNIVQLQPGEGIFQAAGIPHAYLEGQNVELMSNSDNVLRGGLTNKHIDVSELLKHISFEAVKPVILKGEAVLDGERVFHCPVPDFSIAQIQGSAGYHYQSSAQTIEIWVVTEGAFVVNQERVIRQGEAVVVFPGFTYSLNSSGPAVLYRAFVPITVNPQHEEN